jgi:hypothetical protein
MVARDMCEWRTRKDRGYSSKLRSTHIYMDTGYNTDTDPSTLIMIWKNNII